MKELKQAGFHPRKIKEMLLTGKIEKVKPGLYKLADTFSKGTYSQSYIDVCLAMPQAVICLLSALEYHQLTTINPGRISVALPNKGKQNKLEHLPISVYYFRDNLYNCGKEEVETPTGTFRIYCAEKTICDIFRYRNKLGEEIALESLKNYLNNRNADINKLWNYAVQCRIKTIMQPYIKAMVIK